MNFTSFYPPHPTFPFPSWDFSFPSLFPPFSASSLPLALFFPLLPRRHSPLSPAVCVRLHAHVCPDTAVPCPTSAVKHLVNYTAGQREGRWREGGKDAEREKREGDKSSLLTLWTFLAEASVTNVRWGRVMNQSLKCSSSSLMMEGKEGGKKAFP